MTTPIHPDFIGLPATAVAAALGYAKPKSRPRPPMSPLARAQKAAVRTVSAIDKIEGTLPWRDADVARGLRAAMALAQAVANLLYERRVAEVGPLPGGLRLVSQPGDHGYYAVEASEGEPLFEVERDTPASLIRQMAQVYVAGFRSGRAEEFHRGNVLPR